MNKEFRSQFRSLQQERAGHPFIFLDVPAGTQVPEPVIEAMAGYYRTCNANTHGQFSTTRDTDHLLDATRSDVATFLGAENMSNISFGQNMTTLNFSLSKAIGRYLRPGDEILISQLDHESNRGPWLKLQDQGIVVKEIRLLADGHLDYQGLIHVLTPRTKLVAIGLASNMLGTVNQIALVRQLTHEVGAWLLLDAVHYAPHFPIDVQALDCDFLLCSAYKFYGPHVGILYTRTGLLDMLPTDCLRTQIQHAPYKIETGTLNHAAIAGVRAAIHFIANLGEGNDLKLKLKSAYQVIQQHERNLAFKLYQGLDKLSAVKLFGPGWSDAQRAPTISFTWNGKTAEEVCRYLGERSIHAWDGHFYAIRAAEVLGLSSIGGVTRMGISAYTTHEEIEKTLSVLKSLA